MTFHEEWFGPDQQSELVRLFHLSRAAVGGDIIEVGSWEGRSTVALAKAAHPAPVHAIDTWQGSPSDDSSVLATERDVFAAFSENIAALTDGNVVAHRMGWRQFFDGRTEPIRFLFIDAEHTFEEVRDNIIAAVPLMLPGSVMCGDDAGHPPVGAAVRSVFGDWFHDSGVWHWRFP